MEYVNCAICGRNDTETVFNKASLNKDAINVICKNCGLVYVNPRPSSAEYNSFHEEEFLASKNLTKMEQVVPKLKANDLKIKTAVADFLAEFISGEQNILDVGCGFGALLDILRKRYSVNVSGLELGNLDVKVAQEYYGLNVFHGSLEDFSKIKENEGRFNLIILHHVLEHLPEPLESLAEIKKLLKKDGLVYVGVPNIMNIKKRLEEFFQVFHPLSFSPSSLRLLLQKAGFGVIKFNRKAALAGAMELVARPGASALSDEAFKDGRDWKEVLSYVKSVQNNFSKLRKLRTISLFFLPEKVRVKLGRLVYNFMKRR